MPITSIPGARNVDMRIFRRLLPSLGCEPGRQAGRPVVERAVERLSEDEALRDDLTDEGYGPLLAVVANLAIARGDRFVTTDDLYLALRRLLVGAVEAAHTADTSALLTAAVPPLVAPAEQAALAAATPLGGMSADEAAAAIARCLAAATGLEETS